MVPSSVCDSAVSPCLQVSRLSFISISHCTLLSQVPSHHLPSVNCRPCPRTAFQSLFQLQAAALSRGLASLSGMCVAVARIDSLHSDSHRSAVSLSSSLNASPLSQMFPSHAALFLLQFPNPRCGPSSSHSSCFSLLPLSYWVLHGSIYPFLVVRFSAGVPQDLLCLEVYSWRIRGERCTPRAPTLPPSWISVYGIEPTPHSKLGLLWVGVQFLLLSRYKKQWISFSSHLNILLTWSFFLTLCIDICALD